MLRLPPTVRAYSRQFRIRRISAKSRRVVETDSCGIPTKPTWSVTALLSSYPTPTISPATIKHLHQLSALIPPNEETPEHESLKREFEELVRLIEAVKLVVLKDVAKGVTVPDGRVWAEGTGIKLESEKEDASVCVRGGALLQHAARTSEGSYVVDADKTKRDHVG